MGFLRINKVKYDGQDFFYESPEFDKKIVLIEGDNGTGKSTFCNLIYYALGGEIPFFKKESERRHKQITEDRDNYVDLYISINSSNYVVRRYIEDNDITVIPYERIITEGDEESGKLTSKVNFLLDVKKTKIYSVYRSGEKRIFSDWILNELKISVVELYHGYNTFKLNITDLFRLIYHDQQPNPELVYKRPDSKSTLVSDSEMVRKAIFELLVGNVYSEFYDSIVLEKTLNRERQSAKEVLDEYISLSKNLRNGKEIENSQFIQRRIQEKENQLEKLHESRNNFKVVRSSRIDNEVFQEIESLKSDILRIELELEDLNKSNVALFSDRQRIKSVLDESAVEIRRIEKVIFTHDQLNLFSSDTCPYCLAKVDRVEGHCVCGSKIEEKQFERFFYTSKEYKDILKSKLKGIETIQSAYADCTEELVQTKKEIEDRDRLLIGLRTKLREKIKIIDQPVDVDKVNEFDDRILELREDVNELRHQLLVESKIEKLNEEYETVRKKHSKSIQNRKILEAEAKLDISTKVGQFSRVYHDLLTETLNDCWSARIDESNYNPIINDGLYKESSSLVSIRLMYFLSMLKLSIEGVSPAFPRFLLIDTPETAGIELEYLINCIKQIEEVTKDTEECQVILTTGLNKYPDSMRKYRVLYMPDKSEENMLLKRKG